MLIRMNPAIREAPLRIVPMDMPDVPGSPEKEETIIKRIITKMSCTNKKPIEIFPYNFSVSLLSDRSFRIMIVLLNVRAIAMYAETIMGKPSSLLMRKPIREVNTICPIPVTKETFPTSFMTFGLRLIPMMKRRKVTPICEKIDIVSVDLMMLRKYGLTIIPDKMYPMIRGCFSSFVIPATITVIPIIMLSSMNTSILFKRTCLRVKGPNGRRCLLM